VGVESEEDLLERSTIFSTCSWIPCGTSTTLLFKEHFCFHITVAFKEASAIYYTSRNDAFAELGIAGTRLRPVH
jgi:hypothetical protein